MKPVRDYPRLVIVDSEDDPGWQAASHMQGNQTWLMKTEVQGISDSLHKTIKNSPSAHELYRYFVAFTPHKYIYVLVTGQTFQGVGRAKQLTSSPVTTGVLQATDGRDTQSLEVPLVIVNTDVPSYFSVGKNDVREVDWGFIIIHEIGHIWQKVKARAWFEQQSERTAPFVLTTGFITLDYNNLLNWEWPISTELGCPIREHYHLYQMHPYYAEHARSEYEKVRKRRGEDMIEYRFDDKTKAGLGIWRPCSAAIKRACHDWARGAPWRADSFEMDYWRLHHQRYTRG